MLTEYKLRFCDRCGRETDHTFMKFNTHQLIVCNNCQREEISKEKTEYRPEEDNVKRAFKIMNMEEKNLGKRKRLGVVTLEVTTEPLRAYNKPDKSTLVVEYPIWDGLHMPAQVVKHSSLETIPHTDAKEIAKLIDKLVQPPPKEEEETN